EASERRARESLEFLGLIDRAEELASTLPHGDQRLLEIAMAVAQEPALLLLDEPTQGLSPEDTAATVAVIRQVARERKLTIILVEHDMDVVFDLADRISVLHFGQLIAEGTSEEIRANAEVQEAYLGGPGKVLLAVDALHTFYGKSHVLRDVSFTVPAGQ